MKREVKRKAVAKGDVWGRVKLRTSTRKGNTRGARPAADTVTVPPLKVPAGAPEGTKKSTQNPRLWSAAMAVVRLRASPTKGSVKGTRGSGHRPWAALQSERFPAEFA